MRFVIPFVPVIRVNYSCYCSSRAEAVFAMSISSKPMSLGIKKSAQERSTCVNEQKKFAKKRRLLLARSAVLLEDLLLGILKEIKYPIIINTGHFNRKIVCKSSCHPPDLHSYMNLQRDFL